MKKKNIVFFFIEMLVLAFTVLLITDIIPVLLTGSLFKNKYGYEFIAELIMLFIIVIVLFLYRNSYVFTQKKEKFINGVKNGGALLIIGLIIFVQNLSRIPYIGFGTLINLFLYCTAIGMAEEFLCRGWIQNEFIERFGKDKKGVFESIILSAFIFGVMHFTNLLGGQTLLETFLQVIQATSSGFLFGAIYYKTGNIWSTVFLHSFYDFAIMLGEAEYVRDCTTLASPSLALTLYGYYSSLVIIALYTLSGIKLLSKETIESRINEELPKKEKSNKKINIAIIILFVLMLLPISPSANEEYTTCYYYEDYEIKEEYEIRYSSKKDYILSNDEVTINIGIDHNNSLYLLNPTTGQKEILIDYVNDFIVVENDNKFILLAKEIDLIDTRVIYLEINEESLSNAEEYFSELKLNMIELMTPDVEEIGYIHLLNKEKNYPLIRTDLDDIYIVKDKDNIEKLKDAK